MEPCKIRGITQRLPSRTGGWKQRNIFSFRSRDKNVLDIPSPKTLSSVNIRHLESEFGGSFSE